MRAPSTLHVADGADHSLLAAKTTLKALGSTQEEADDQILIAITGFLENALGDRP
jgi:hypothetical protein